jgi:hypothetical protein
MKHKRFSLNALPVQKWDEMKSYKSPPSLSKTARSTTFAPKIDYSANKSKYKEIPDLTDSAIKRNFNDRLSKSMYILNETIQEIQSKGFKNEKLRNSINNDLKDILP